jgi:S-adenosylmethionine:tRNA ribosyltransferase-isomerase
MTDDLDQHPMHSEEIEVGPAVCDQIRATKTRGGRVVAVGTTAVRALESADRGAAPGELRPTKRATDLLIQPGYSFAVVDALLTNFHQPRSTLLALVSALIGLGRLREAYEEAIRQRYRFLSYGDAMWIPQVLQESPA